MTTAAPIRSNGWSWRTGRLSAVLQADVEASLERLRRRPLQVEVDAQHQVCAGDRGHLREGLDLATRGVGEHDAPAELAAQLRLVHRLHARLTDALVEAVPIAEVLLGALRGDRPDVPEHVGEQVAAPVEAHGTGLDQHAGYRGERGAQHDRVLVAEPAMHLHGHERVDGGKARADGAFERSQRDAGVLLDRQ